MKVGVIGSRIYNNYDVVKNVLDKLNIKHITSGGAKGADSLAKKYAIEHNIPIVEILPDWNTYGKSAGYIRNKDIIKQNRLVIAFIKGDSYGTLHSLSLCKKYCINHIVFDIEGNLNKDLTTLYSDYNYTYTWSRKVNKGEPYYECSSKGHTEYSALYAKLDNKSIEEIYQLDIKGYRDKVDHWKDAKGKPNITTLTDDELYIEYLSLWSKYFLKNTHLYLRILKDAKGKTITDMFGTSKVNQARAICDLCNYGLLVK